MAAAGKSAGNVEVLRIINQKTCLYEYLDEAFKMHTEALRRSVVACYT